MSQISEFKKHIVTECPFCSKLIYKEYSESDDNVDLILDAYNEHLNSSPFCKKSLERLPDIFDFVYSDEERYSDNIIDFDKKRKEKEGQKVYYLRNPWHPINRFEDLKKEMELMKNPPDLGIRIIAYDNTKKSWISKLLDLFKRRKIE